MTHAIGAARNLDDVLTEYHAACLAGDNKIGLRTRLEHELDALEAADKTVDAANAARLTAPGALKAAALWYASQGIAVFPLEPRGKQPIVKTGFKAATTDRTQIAAWWDATPTANIGTPTGHTFDVVDIDGPTGVRTWATTPDLYDELARERIGHVLTSRDGGHHIYVRAVAGRGNRAGMFPGIDYRGAGGYVVLPPSIGANGVRYAWHRPLEVNA